jgi:branched-chain amino acid transport system ATP-binding protein
MKKAPDNDKIRRRAATESSEKQAQKVRQMESRIARLEEVAEPRKEWVLEFTIGAAPRSSSVVATLDKAVVRQGEFVLGPVSLQVDAGERIGITGPNGAGKSTLLAALMGLLPSRGSVRYAGQDVAAIPVELRVAAGLTLVPERRELFGELSVQDNLRLGAFQRVRRGEKGAADDLREVYERFPRLRERREQLAVTLSGGERQMLAIGVGLMGAPSLLMLDEPTLGLAPKLKDELLEAIGKISRAGVPLVLVEQDVEFLVALTDRLYMINHGAVALDVASTDRLDHAEIMQMYFGEH